jgi:stearoyl-CoA desaturase (delta-9 desaturase)
MHVAEKKPRPRRGLRRFRLAPRQLDLPAEVQPLRIDWGYLWSIAGIHVLSLLILLPWCFSWTGVVLFVAGLPLYGMFGITLCYHRLLTHQGFTCPKWLEHCFAVLGVCCLQDTPARWVAVHRLHHQHSDEQADPHSPLVNFFWAHMGWVLVRHREHSRLTFFEQYARDILRDPFYLALERKLAWFWVYWLHALTYFAAGLASGRLTGGTWLAGLQFGISLLVWGVFFRTVFVWHATWAVNSVTHVLGYRNYETTDASRNFWPVALVGYGEGWHNNHHADQRAAAHGHKWWEIDMTYATICLMERFGLARDVVRPRVWRTAEPTTAAAQPAAIASSPLALSAPATSAVMATAAESAPEPAPAEVVHP